MILLRDRHNRIIWSGLSPLTVCRFSGISVLILAGLVSQSSQSVQTGLLTSRLRGYDILQATEVAHKIVKRASNPSPNDYNNMVDIRFFALDKNFRLTLTPKASLFAPDMEFAAVDGDGARTPFYVNTEAFYGGHVFGEKDSAINLHYENNQFTGSVRTSDEVYYFEPADLHLPGAGEDATLVYRKSDIIVNDSVERNESRCAAVSVDDDVGDFDDLSLSRDKRQIPTFVPTHTRCGLRLVADHRFFTSIGARSTKRTVTYLINIIDRVNAIYNSTNWNEGHDNDPLLGYGFVIQAINVLTEATRTRNGDPHYNDATARGDSKEILDLFSRDPDHQNFCLAHLFTDQVLESGVLGLAYVGNGRRGSAGGICSASYEKEGRQLYLNSGLTTCRNQFNQIVITREMELVTAHELGHNWGSQHDPETKECTPESKDGGRYLMYMYSVTGLETNNKFFSPCSRRSIRDVLLGKSGGCFQKPQKSLCGNFLVEDGEECDAGYMGADDKDYCCDRHCRLRPTAKCSNRNSPCCENCTFMDRGRICFPGNRDICQGTSYCTGENAECPAPPAAPDGTFCFDDGQCRAGQCLSFCETKGLISCVCDNIMESCLVCCRKQNETCHPHDFSKSLKSYKSVPDGRACIQGTCLQGTCRKTSVDFVARVWLVIERIDFSNFAGFLKNNIVGTVIILTLIVWIPGSCLIHRMDKKYEEEHPDVYGTLRKSVIAQSTHDVSRTPLIIPRVDARPRWDGPASARVVTSPGQSSSTAASGRARAGPKLANIVQLALENQKREAAANWNRASEANTTV
ncbi:ADAM 17-like protease isoform X2 [Paramacrobiotus metropolitanus]|uniref:ADAM 17-like protease isoform X2 n=1 Tax=Paramacrobiotus metropolitanus TaxID=2943436 RepID=UPI0024460446|nr:ADAM 17-like protease isoform X2 [Paramacrobiotus metropolitanus]